MPGISRLGDKAKCENHKHGCPACPHPVVMGPSVTASANVFVDGIPAMTYGDTGIHAACCGPNVWQVIDASAGVFINGKAAVRKGDKTLHCATDMGKMIEASGTVFDNSPGGGMFAIPGAQRLLTVDGPGVVVIPDGAAIIRDDNGNPVGYAWCDEHSEIGHVYDANGNPVGSFPVPEHAAIQEDNSLLNPIDLMLLPIGGAEKEAGKVALKGLGKLLKKGAGTAAKKAAQEIPKSKEDLYARIYNKAVDATHKPVGDGRPGPMPGSLPPKGAKDVAMQVGTQAVKNAGKTLFDYWKKKHGIP